MSARALRRNARVPGAQRQRGLALLVAIILVALGTMIAATIGYENAMTARRGLATQGFDQSILVAQGAEALAAYGLKQTIQSDNKQLYVGQGCDQPLGPIEVVPGVMLEAWLEDLGGRFNLNTLVQLDGTADPLMTKAFTQLLEIAEVEPKWTGYIVDWISSSTQPSIPEGAKDSVYMGQTVPYRTANRYITSTSELLALPGFGRDRYLKIAPYITALPIPSKINVCTAQGAVLDAFSGQREYSANPEQLAKDRQQAKGCFPTLANYQTSFRNPTDWTGTGGPQARPGVVPGNSLQNPSVPGGRQPGTQGAQSKFAQVSSYFRLTSIVSIGSTEFNLYSLLYLDQQQQIRPVQRSFTPD